MICVHSQALSWNQGCALRKVLLIEIPRKKRLLVRSTNVLQSEGIGCFVHRFEASFVIWVLRLDAQARPSMPDGTYQVRLQRQLDEDGLMQWRLSDFGEADSS